MLPTIEKNQIAVEQFPHQVHLLLYRIHSLLLFPQYFYLHVLLLEENYPLKFPFLLFPVRLLNDHQVQVQVFQVTRKFYQHLTLFHLLFFLFLKSVFVFKIQTNYQMEMFAGSENENSRVVAVAAVMEKFDQMVVVVVVVVMANRKEKMAVVGVGIAVEVKKEVVVGKAVEKYCFFFLLICLIYF